MINAQNRMDSIHKFIVVSGFIALLLSVIMGMQFYSSLAHNVIGQVTYVTAGALLTCLVVLTLSIALYSFQKGFAIMGTMLTILWITLISLEILAEFGFLATQQERRAMEVAANSSQAKRAGDSLDSATAKVENLSQYASADINALQGELAGLQAELDGAEAKLAGCPSNYVTKCKNPARAEISRIEKKMEPLTTQINGYQSYQAALANKDNASKALDNTLTGKDVGLAMSPAYTWLSRLTGIESENIQAGTSFLIAFLLSIWASFAGFILLRIKGDDQGQGRSDFQVAVAAPAGQASGSYLTRADLDVLLTEKLALLSPPATKTVEVVDSPKL